MATNGEKPIIPPLRKPVSEFPTPDPSVAFYTELVNRDDPAYKANSPVKRGAKYATMVGAKQEVISIYPDLFFLRERKFQLNDQLVLWDWATDEQAHDTYNSTVNYMANAVTFPAFTRTYTIRRELYEAEPALPIGSPLPGIIAVTITSPGQNYTQAVGVIDGTSVSITFTISPNGGLLNGIITNTGSEQITNGTEITIIGDGQDGSAFAVSQPVGCVLTQQSKQERPDGDPLQHELVEVSRVYETLPGPWIYSKRIDKDGAIVTAKTRRQVADFITDNDLIENGEWVQTWHKGTDNFVAEETVESRPLPGNPIVTLRDEIDGMVTTITKTLIDARLATAGETLIDGIWTQTKTEELASTTFVKDTSASEKVVWQVSEARPIPGNPIPSTDLDKDGMEIDIIRTMKDATLIVTNDTVSGGIWVRTNAEQITDLVSWEVVKGRAVPGNIIPAFSVGADHEIATIGTTLRESTTIIPEAVVLAGNTYQTVEAREVSDLVSDEVVTIKEELDTALYAVSIENLIPREFRAFIPTVVESHILPGTASMPTLGPGEFEHSQKQQTKLFYEDRITSLGDITLPITHTNQELTEEYGGGVLNVSITLDSTGVMSIDQGYLVTRSSLTILGNGMDIKETAELDGNEWPGLLSSLWDDNFREQYLEFQQVVPVGTAPDINPGYFAFVSEIKKIDDWRSLKVNVAKDTPAYTDESNALISYDYRPFKFPGLAPYFSVAYFRQPVALLVQHKIRTWWVNSVTAPTIAIDEIITGSILQVDISGTSEILIHDVLFDDTVFQPIFFPATTPSYTEYTGRVTFPTDGTLTLSFGSTSVTGSGTSFLSQLEPGDLLNASQQFAVDTILSDTSLTLTNPWTVTQGTFPNGPIQSVWMRPSLAWIGTEKIVSATVTQEREPNVWKVQTRSVVMR